MSSLIDIMKKRADLAKFESRLSKGGVDPSSAVPEFEQAALEHYRDLIRSGQMEPTEAHSLLRRRLRERPEIERQAFESGSSMYAPTYGGVGTQLAIGTGLGWGLDKVISAIKGQPAQPVGQHLANMLSPAQLIPKTRSLGALLPLLFFSANYLARPFQDPAYQRGESGYLSSLASSLSGAGRETRKRMGEAEQQYGTLGALPVHALNFAMDPVGGIAAAGTKAKEMLLDKEGELLDEAAKAVDRALRTS
jgi:hypothetical protein